MDEQVCRWESKKWRCISNDFDAMQPYWRWILALYGRELMQKYGNLELVKSRMVPIGILKLMKSGKVRWKG